MSLLMGVLGGPGFKLPEMNLLLLYKSKNSKDAQK